MPKSALNYNMTQQGGVAQTGQGLVNRDGLVSVQNAKLISCLYDAKTLFEGAAAKTAEAAASGHTLAGGAGNRK